jgi:hypothetical protein
MKRIGAIAIDGDSFDFSEIADKFGYVSRSVLFQVGLRAAKQLYRKNLRGILNPRSFSGSGVPLSPTTGTRMLSFSISRDNRSVTVRSFPMNVYRAKGETGPRSMKRTAGRGIFRSFESGFNAAEAAETALDYILRNSDLFKPEPDAGFNTRLK